jgi:hypothetical protein
METEALMAPKKKRVKGESTRATFSIPLTVRKDMVKYLSHLNWSAVVTERFKELVEAEKKKGDK